MNLVVTSDLGSNFVDLIDNNFLADTCILIDFVDFDPKLNYIFDVL
jgi:hypothetical protein